jgi:hypothetical protein
VQPAAGLLVVTEVYGDARLAIHTVGPIGVIKTRGQYDQLGLLAAPEVSKSALIAYPK